MEALEALKTRRSVRKYADRPIGREVLEDLVDCELVGAPRGFKLVSLVPLGFPGEEPRQEKRALADVLHWERY